MEYTSTGIVINIPNKGFHVVGLNVLKLGDDLYPELIDILVLHQLIYRIPKTEKYEEEQIVDFIPSKNKKYCKILKIR